MISAQNNESSRILAGIAAEKMRLLTVQLIREKSDVIKNFVLTRKQQFENGFPVVMFNNVHVEPNEFQANRALFYAQNDTRRVCTRCRTEFHVAEDGIQKACPATNCTDADGAVHKFHVHDQQPMENLKKFKRAPKVSYLNEYMSRQMFAVDVEMVYTSRGQAVGRVTLVDHLGATVVDALVKPEDEIIDPVTKYSGLTMAQLEHATETLESVREKIFDSINENSILIGHGLHGDLKALHILHDKLIDTSLLFGRRRRRRSLRSLTEEHLGYRIQHHPGGHCSKEDARAALRLVLFAASNPSVLGRF